MATYYVRMNGSDAAAGTSAGAAWRTLGKALGASGIASGDTLYVGAGIYREAVSVAMTSATADTYIIGDNSGQYTGDPGEVIWTSFLNGWNDTPSGSAPLNLNGRDYLSLRNLHLIGGAGANGITSTTTTSVNITVDNCVVQSFGTNPIAITNGFAIAANWTIKNSLIVSMVGSPAITLALVTGVGADYDTNFQIIDSVIWAANATGVNITNSGTAANKGGGVDILRCTIIGSNGVTTTASQLSTSIPCTVQDCILFTSTGMNSGTSGQITDLGGTVTTGSFTNVTLHATTRTNTHDFPAQVLSYGHEWMWGMQPRIPFSPLFPDSLGRGTISSATTDMSGRSRLEGGSKWDDSGTATAGAATTITDSGKAWMTNEHIGRLVRITGGTGSGQVKHISSNTATVLTIGGLSGDWATTPDATSTYIIYEGPPAETNKATSGSTTTFVVSGAAWSVNKWAGYTLEITAGTGVGESKTITSNTSTTLTTAAFIATLDNTSVGSIYWPGTSLTATQRTPGALERHDTALKETSVTDAGSVGICVCGPGSHEFLIPVDTTSTTISVKVRYDTNHGTTNKPQAILLANGENGVTTETVTMTSAADTWETLTFAAQTPTAKGVVTVRLVSRSDTPYGKAYFDTFAVA